MHGISRLMSSLLAIAVFGTSVDTCKALDLVACVSEYTTSESMDCFSAEENLTDIGCSDFNYIDNDEEIAISVESGDTEDYLQPSYDMSGKKSEKMLVDEVMEELLDYDIDDMTQFTEQNNHLRDSSDESGNGDMLLLSSETTWQNDYEYDLDENSKSIILTKYKGDDIDIIVPNSAAIGDTSYLTVISGNTFGFCNIETISFEKGCKAASSLAYLFYQCNYLKSVDLSGLDTSGTTDMHAMFESCGLSDVDVSMLETGNVTDMGNMFYSCLNLQNISLSGLNTASLTNMNSMFLNCYSLSRVCLNDLNTSNVKDMGFMFYGCRELASLEINGIDTSSVENMSSMFSECRDISSIVSSVNCLNTSSVKNMSRMFERCNFSVLDLYNFDTSNVTDMSYMFYGCCFGNDIIDILDLSSFNTSKSTNHGGIFCNANIGILDIRNMDLSETNLYSVLHNSTFVSDEIWLPAKLKQCEDTQYVWAGRDCVLYFPGTKDEWLSFGYKLRENQKIICSDGALNASGEEIEDDVLRIKSFQSPSSSYIRQNIDGFYAYVFSISEAAESINIDLTVTQGATWDLFKDEACTEEKKIENHIATLDKNTGDHYFYVKVTKDENSSIFMLDFKITHVTTLHYMRNDPFVFRKWSVEQLLNSSDIPREDIAQISLILSAKSESENARSELDSDFYELGLVDSISDASIWHYLYTDFNPGCAAHSFALRKYTKGDNTYNIITVVCRGTSGMDDFLLDTMPDGFLNSASIIYSDLKQFLSDRGIDSVNAENNRYFITGHSLGGASANLLQYLLMADGGCYGNNITCYTYASPYTTWSYNYAPTTYGLGINFIRDVDTVPKLSNSYSNVLQSAKVNRFNLSAIATLGEALQLYSKKTYKAMRYGKDYYLGPSDDIMRKYWNQLNNDNYGDNDNWLIPRHVCETYMSCLLADIETGRFANIVQHAKEHSICSIYCPVDVYVIDSETNDTVASIVNNTVMGSGNENVSICALGDAKFVQLDSKSKYCIKLVGNGSGTMEYDLQCTSYNDGNAFAENLAVFENVALFQGKVMSDSFDSEDDAGTKLYVLDDKGNRTKEIAEDGSEKEIATVPQGLWGELVANPLSGDGIYYFNGKAIRPEVRVYDGDTPLTANKDYTIKYANNVKAYTLSESEDGFYDKKGKTQAPTITVTGKGNYSGKDVIYFKILPVDISTNNDEAYCDPLTVVNSGKSQKPVPVMNVAGTNLKATKDFEVSYYRLSGYQSVDEPGEALSSVTTSDAYLIRLTGKGNYSGIREVPLSVVDSKDGKLVTKLTYSKIANQNYDAGKAIQPSVTVTDGKKILVERSQTESEDYDYTVHYENNKRVGTAYVIITGNPLKGYNGTKRIPFKITGVSLTSAKITGMPASFVYTGTDINVNEDLKKGTITLSIKGKAETLSIYDPNTGQGDYTVSYNKNRNTGTATIIFTGINGYTGAFKKTFRILPCSLNNKNITVSRATEEDVPYEKGGAKEKVVIEYGDILLIEGTDYTLSYKNNNKAGQTASITIRGKGNYKDLYNGKLTFAISAKNISECSVSAVDRSFSDKKNNYPTTVKIFDHSGKQLASNTDYVKLFRYTYPDGATVTRITGKKADEIVRAPGDEVDKEDIIPANTKIRVTVTGKNNYYGECWTDYRIMRASISSAKVTAKSKIFSGKPVTLSDADITVKVGNKRIEPVDETTGEKNWEIVPGSEKNNTNKGTASVQIRGLGNYGGIKTVTFKIIPKGFSWWWRLQ